MGRTIAYTGQCYSIQYARRANGEQPGLDFYERLDQADKAKMNVLFARLGDQGHISSKEKFRKLRDELWEFKSFQIRMICTMRPGKRTIISHGFMKKGDKTPDSEITRARQILEEDSGQA